MRFSNAPRRAGSFFLLRASAHEILPRDLEPWVGLLNVKVSNLDIIIDKSYLSVFLFSLILCEAQSEPLRSGCKKLRKNILLVVEDYCLLFLICSVGGKFRLYVK